ncbi:MAG TPA: prepilin-type N-terminal cleavage/methylation domain-containing protein [Thermoanaerobaculia bacterium]|jgi:prepilin-type N-terminal cleavage/methylation domain-containing protein
MKNTQRGFNLVEVLVAMAITAVVILSVATLFVMGRRNVYAGKQMTAAVAVATRITEDFSHMTHAEVYDKFGLSPDTGYAGATLAASNTVEGVPYANSVLRTNADAADANKDKAKLIDTWLKLMQPSFVNPKITVVFMPRLDVKDPATDTATVPVSTVLQIRVVLTWDDSVTNKRHRSLMIDAVKTQRT